VGFITVGRGVTIHQQECAALKKALAQNGHEAKILPAEWDIHHLPVRRVSVRVECFDRKGLLTDVTSIITSNNIFILESKTKSKGDSAILKFLIEVKSVEQLNQLFNQLRQVKGVTNLTRDSRTTEM
jgi:GTP pyrophosphokinase